MKLTLNQAAKEAGVSKSTLSKAVKQGKISVEKDGNRFLIDPAELFRVFPKKSESTDEEQSETVLSTDGEHENVRTLEIEINGLKELVKAKDQTIDELRARIDDLQKSQQLLTYYRAPFWERFIDKLREGKKDSDSSAARSD